LDLDDADVIKPAAASAENAASCDECAVRNALAIEIRFWPPERACQLAVFSGKLACLEAEIDDKLPSNCLAGFVSRRK
jgi:hypothetical protein